MATENQPVDAIPVNGWFMELADGLVSPHFHKVSGLNRKTGVMEVVDGGSNRKYFFSDGIVEHAPVSIVRTRDGTSDDQTFASFVRDAFANGAKVDGTLTQFRHGEQVLQITFQGLLMNDYALTDFDVHGADKSDQTYVCQCDWWEDSHGP